MLALAAPASRGTSLIWPNGMLLFLFIPLLIGWVAQVNLPAVIGIGLMLGVAGSSFAVALPAGIHLRSKA